MVTPSFYFGIITAMNFVRMVLALGVACFARWNDSRKPANKARL
jgi:hypothetical protein